jgi:hypothetical protein
MEIAMADPARDGSYQHFAGTWFVNVDLLYGEGLLRCTKNGGFDFHGCLLSPGDCPCIPAQMLARQIRVASALVDARDCFRNMCVAWLKAKSEIQQPPYAHMRMLTGVV